MFNPQFFDRTTRCHPLGSDIVYLPTVKPSKNFAKLPVERGWMEEFVPAEMIYAKVPSLLCIEALRNAYDAHCARTGKEPKWISLLNRWQQKDFRWRYRFSEAELLYALPTVPFAGIGYYIEDSGFTEDVCKVFNLGRLLHIAQLGRLHDPVVTDCGTPPAYGLVFEHNRLAHSLDARAIALLMALNNNLNPQLTCTLEVAGLTHDARTPAYGDGAKAIDPDFFDEDANYPELLTGTGWEALREKYSIDEDKLWNAVQGRGLLGSLLDVADKLSYLSRDVLAYLGRYCPDGPVAYPQGYHDIRALVRKRKYVLGLWSSVRVVRDRVVFDDKEWLGDVLRLRALMFKNLYFHPGSRYLERMSGVILVRHLIDTEVIRKEHLLRIDDQDLDRILEKHFGQEVNPTIIGLYDMEPRVEVCVSIDDALRRERELLQSGVSVTFIDEHPPAKGGTRFLVRKDRKICSFAEACPREAEEIETIARSTPTVALYHLAVAYNDLPMPLQKVADVIRERAFSPTVPS